MVALRSDTYRKTLYMLETPKALSTPKCNNLKDVTMDNQQINYCLLKK